MIVSVVNQSLIALFIQWTFSGLQVRTEYLNLSPDVRKQKGFNGKKDGELKTPMVQIQRTQNQKILILMAT